jgi:hypothetical protein
MYENDKVRLDKKKLKKNSMILVVSDFNSRDDHNNWNWFQNSRDDDNWNWLK